MAEPNPPTPANTDTLEPKTAASPGGAGTQTFVIGGVEPEPQVGDESIRPFQFRASDEDLADLKRRILRDAMARSRNGQ